MPKANILGGLEKLLQGISQDLSDLKKQLTKLGKPGRRGKPGRKPKAGRRGRLKLKGLGRRAGKTRVCSVRGCGRKHYAKGLCVNHYQSARLKAKKVKVTQAVSKRRGRPRVEPKICSKPGCQKIVEAKGLCMNHYQQMRRKARRQER